MSNNNNGQYIYRVIPNDGHLAKVLSNFLAFYSLFKASLLLFTLWAEYLIICYLTWCDTSHTQHASYVPNADMLT